MNEEKATLCFVVTGEWVTEHLRRLFFAEKSEGHHKPLDEVLEVALSCMSGTSMKERKLKILAVDVLLGKRKFIGRTDDGSYALVEDEENSNKETYAEFVKDNYYMSPYTFDLVYNSLITYQKNEEWEDERERMKQYSDSYGWLSPKGDFHPVEWGDHINWAYKYLNEHPELDVKNDRFLQAGDRLCSVGWILLHNPSQGRAFVSKSATKNPTKAQREFLYDYFTCVGAREEAESWLCYE